MALWALVGAFVEFIWTHTGGRGRSVIPIHLFTWSWVRVLFPAAAADSCLVCSQAAASMMLSAEVLTAVKLNRKRLRVSKMMQGNPSSSP